MESKTDLLDKCKTNGNQIKILINHTKEQHFKKYTNILSGKTFGDNYSNIKFIVEDEEIPSHSEVLQILSNQRQLVRELIERDKQSSKVQNCLEANIFQMSGTSFDGFYKLIQYIYSGKVECDLKTGIDLAITAHKLKFQYLVESIAKHLSIHLEEVLDLETVDDLYAIAKNTSEDQFIIKCAEFMDKNAVVLSKKFLKRDIKPNDSSNCLTYCYEKPCYRNYIHFLLPISPQICFNVMVSQDRINWTTILKNDKIFSNFWNWVYFKEMRVKYIRIVCNDIEDEKNGINYNIQSLEDKSFLCKRANIDLTFDANNRYLIPKHDVIEYPIPLTKQVYDDSQKNGYTFVTSKANAKEKEKYYYYHRVGDGKPLEFYLSQTCLISSFRFRLWDLDERSYDFKVEIKNEEQNDDEWVVINDGNEKVFRKRNSWQIISFPLQPIRWIRITGIKSPVHDPEFAIIHFECPKQLTQ